MNLLIVFCIPSAESLIKLQMPLPNLLPNLLTPLPLIMFAKGSSISLIPVPMFFKKNAGSPKISIDPIRRPIDHLS